MRIVSISRTSLALFRTGLAGTLVLSACGAKEETTYKANAEDASGGDLVVVPAEAEGVAVELPESPMTPEVDVVTEGAASNDAATDSITPPPPE